MKPGWEIKPLGEVADIYSGNSIPAKVKQEKYLGVAEGLFYLGTKDIGYGEDINPETEVRIPHVEKENFKVAPEGATLVCSEGGSAGKKIGFLNADSHFGNKLFAVVSLGELCPRFFFHFAQSDYFNEQFEDHKTGLIGGVSKNKFKKILIPLPSLEEQRRILAVLDTAFKGLDCARTNIEANLEESKGIFASALGGVFSRTERGWRIGTVESAISDGALVKPIDGNHGETHPKKSDFVESGIPFIMASDLENGRVNQKQCYFLTYKQASGLRKGFSRTDDILLSHKGTIGRVAKLVTSLEYVMLTPQVTYYRSADHSVLLPDYIYYFLQSEVFQKPLNDVAGGGATRAYIGITKQRTLPFYYPSIDKQLEFVKLCKQIETSSKQAFNSYTKNILELKNLRQSLLQKAFAGKLT